MNNEQLKSKGLIALQALKDYANSKEYSVHDRVRVHSIFQFKDEAQRLIYGE